MYPLNIHAIKLEHLFMYYMQDRNWAKCISISGPAQRPATQKKKTICVTLQNQFHYHCLHELNKECMNIYS